MTQTDRNFYKTHKAFSLLELIVVVLIVSLIGFLVFSSAIKQQQQTEILDASTLPATFRESFKGQGAVELVCIKKCEECYVIQEANIIPYDGGTSFGKDVEIYTVDNDNQLVQLDDFGRLKDKKICLRYSLNANGSTSQMVVVNNHGIYYLPSYFGKAKKVTDMQEAKDLWIKEEYSLRDSGSFY